MTTTANNNQANFFNLHLTGLAYVNRMREVKPKKGNPFTSVTLAFLRGSSDDVEYTYVDCIVRGSDALSLLQQWQESISDQQKVLVTAKVGDIFPEAFEHNNKTYASIKGRLLTIDMMKVNGDLVFEAEKLSKTDYFKKQNPTVTLDPQDPELKTREAWLANVGYEQISDFEWKL
ncbi:hypothetical protein THMIRHAS_17050 [Thiosulfatimonas sediminis]|uniref:Uncharacterized protein n=1 Tax=Thiosulfatimonas sediminis TaxID=2675054 RepID=A0A6F8PW06_9GAMM|nr:DUF3577 domain-containing protein [Thiosulfatimonas sediminis]BBP46332.1 hypothetical protein THMIRHAS_17050 [Thiosulfatimonas sediminis]